MSTFFSIMFLGGYLVPTFGLISYDSTLWFQPIALGLKTSLILFIFIWVSGSTLLVYTLLNAETIHNPFGVYAIPGGERVHVI